MSKWKRMLQAVYKGGVLQHGARSTEKLERLEAPSVCMRVFRQIFCLEILILCVDLLRNLQLEITKSTCHADSRPPDA